MLCTRNIIYTMLHISAQLNPYLLSSLESLPNEPGLQIKNRVGWSRGSAEYFQVVTSLHRYADSLACRLKTFSLLPGHVQCLGSASRSVAL